MRISISRPLLVCRSIWTRGRLSFMSQPPVQFLLPGRPDPLDLLHRRRVIPVVPLPAPGPAHGTVPGIGSRRVGELVTPLQWFHIAASAAFSWRVSVALGRANMYRMGSDLSIRPTSIRSEEHTSELQSRFGISNAVFCLK